MVIVSKDSADFYFPRGMPPVPDVLTPFHAGHPTLSLPAFKVPDSVEAI